MADIKKIYADAAKTMQLYPQTHEKAVIDNNGTTLSSKLGMLTDLVNQKQMESGSVPSDLTPTEDSSHWVTSGGIFAAMQNIKEKSSLDAIWTDGYGINYSNGELSINSYFSYSNYIDISLFEEVEISLLGANNTIGAAFYDSSKTYISGIHDYTNTWTYSTQKVSTPSGAKYIRLTSPSSTSGYIPTIGYAKVIGEGGALNVASLRNDFNTEEPGKALDARIGVGILDLVGGKGYSPDLSYEKGAINATTGNIDRESPQMAVYECSYMYDVTLFSKIVVAYPTGSSKYGLAFYDSSKTYISGGHNSTAGSHGYLYDNSLVIPDNAVYMRVTRYQSSAYGDFQCRLFVGEKDGVNIGETKQCNPFFTTFDSYNTDNPSSTIVKEDVFSTSLDGGGGAVRRIPAMTITNANTLLAACEVRSSTADNSQTGIVIARKSSGTWSYNNILPYDANTYGKCMNPSFVIDRSGAQGNTGRIYLFFLHFPITAGNNGYAKDASASEMDCSFITSDDDGVTWSSMTSVKSAWDANEWIWVGVSPSNGAQMSDGTFIFPCMGRYSGKWYSGVLWKTISGSWSFSKKSLMGNDNESCIFDYGGEVYLNCRNENDGHIRTLYKLDISTGALNSVSYQYDPNVICQQSISKGVVSSKTIYLQSANDPYTYNTRNRLTIFISNDGINWQRLIRVNEATTYGYSSIDVYSSKYAIAYENSGTISVIDMTNAVLLINTTASRSLGQSMEQRMQLLLEKYI